MAMLDASLNEQRKTENLKQMVQAKTQYQKRENA
jgi:hypothetical protein